MPILGSYPKSNFPVNVPSPLSQTWATWMSQPNGLTASMQRVTMTKMKIMYWGILKICALSKKKEKKIEINTETEKQC